MTELSKVVRQEVPTIDALEKAPMKINIPFISDQTIKEKFLQHTEKAGITLTDEQKDNIKVKDGVITSPDIRALKDMMGLDASNDAVNEQLKAALKSKVVVGALKDEMARGNATEIAQIPSNSVVLQPVNPQQAGGEKPVLIAASRTNESAAPKAEDSVRGESTHDSQRALVNFIRIIAEVLPEMEKELNQVLGAGITKIVDKLRASGVLCEAGKTTHPTGCFGTQLAQLTQERPKDEGIV